jgi:PhzF family phenazine biosynthesis protein
MRTEIIQVDVFATEPYSGNPAAVCLLDRDRSDAWMGQVAREMACTNSAFARRRPDIDGYDLRWFTAGGVEVSLCGHATLATAHVLFEQGLLTNGETAIFHTRSGPLTALRSEDGNIEMSFPLEIATQEPESPTALISGLGCEARWVGRNRLDYIVEVTSEEVLRNIKPNFSVLGEIDTRGIIVTAPAESPRDCAYDYVLRFFGPKVGVPEDLVTGTAHCALGPYWKARFADGRDSFVAYQASPRGGLVNVRVCDDRVLIAGKAVTVLTGSLLA